MSLIVLLVAVVFVAWGLTALLRRYALAKSLLDVPNARSSHTLPTPRGGGAAIVVAFLLAISVAFMSFALDPQLFYALLGAGAAIALLGFLDDHGHIAARWRLLGHFAAAIWALYWLGGLPPMAVFGGWIDLGWLGQGLAALYLVWLLNLYNFMDGIDGIASVEAICVCLGGAILYAVVDAPPTSELPLLILAAAVLGFLLWNFPPAKIFMGDAGSGFLGIALGVLSLQAAWVDPVLFWGWLILLGVFVVDATFTLLRRLLRGDKVYQAHRSHAYQRATRKVGGHFPVTFAVLAINVCWLLPISIMVAIGWVDGLLALTIAYIPLLSLAFMFKAGNPDS